MKSKTSFCNPTVLKKDITRFAPVWGLYAVFLLILFMTSYTSDPVYMARDVLDIISGTSVVNLLYGCLCASVLFGDLFSSRMCNALHAMPLRRDSWFCTHAVAGLLLCVIPNVAGSLLLMAMLQQYWYMALLWLAVTVLEFLFFFGVGAFSVMCAGNRLGMLAVYAIINFFSLLVFLLVDQLYLPLLYGLDQAADWYKFFCPVYHLGATDFVRLTYNLSYTSCRIGQIYWSQWIYLAVTALIGVGLMGAAMLLYRRRKLESAGDFLALRKLEPVFWVIYTLACGVFLHALSYIFGFSANYFLTAIGVTVGAFTGRMLLERTVRVFRKKNVLGYAILLLTLAASLVITGLDPIGITRYQPETEEIAYMRVYDPSCFSEYGDPDMECWQLESAAEIEAFRKVHRQLMDERNTDGDYLCQVEILYGLKDGSTVTRYYSVKQTSAAYDSLKSHFSDWRYLFNTGSFAAFREQVVTINLNLFGDYPPSFASQSITDPERIAQFMEAVKLDCEAGNMAWDHSFHTDAEELGWGYIDYGTALDHTATNFVINRGYADLTLHSDATHISALLERWLAEYTAS